MPLEIGSKKTFVHRQDRTVETQGESLGDERWVGTREEQVLVAPADQGEATAELRVKTRTTSAAGEQVETLVFLDTPTAKQPDSLSARDKLVIHGQRLREQGVGVERDRREHLVELGVAEGLRCLG